MLASGVVALGLWDRSEVAFNGMIVLDQYSVFFKVLFAAAGTLTILMSPRYLEANQRNLGEYYVLLLFALVGMDLMAASRDLIAFYVGLELMAVSSYLLAGFFRYQTRSNEAALKYFLTGTFASAITLYGVSLLYGLSGATNYAAVGAGGAGQQLGHAGRSGHRAGGRRAWASRSRWCPSTCGLPTSTRARRRPIAGFFSVGPKAAGFSAILMIFLTVFAGTSDTWSTLFVVLSILTMLVGNLFALVQKNVKRMLAYSSIAHVGYLLAGLAALGKSGEPLAGQAILLYLVCYTFMNMGAFGILAYLKTQSPEGFDYSLTDFAGLARRTPWAAILMALFMFSLTGIPGTAGFIGKFYLFNAVVQADLTWLAVIAVIFSAVSAYYYLRVIMYMFFREPEQEFATKESINGPLAAGLALAAVGVLVIGVLPPTVMGRSGERLQGHRVLALEGGQQPHIGGLGDDAGRGLSGEIVARRRQESLARSREIVACLHEGPQRRPPSRLAGAPPFGGFRGPEPVSAATQPPNRHQPLPTKKIANTPTASMALRPVGMGVQWKAMRWSTIVRSGRRSGRLASHPLPLFGHEGGGRVLEVGDRLARVVDPHVVEGVVDGVGHALGLEDARDQQCLALAVAGFVGHDLPDGGEVPGHPVHLPRADPGNGRVGIVLDRLVIVGQRAREGCHGGCVDWEAHQALDRHQQTGGVGVEDEADADQQGSQGDESSAEGDAGDQGRLLVLRCRCEARRAVYPATTRSGAAPPRRGSPPPS